MQIAGSVRSFSAAARPSRMGASLEARFPLPRPSRLNGRDVGTAASTLAPKEAETGGAPKRRIGRGHVRVWCRRYGSSWPASASASHRSYRSGDHARSMTSRW